MWYDIKCPVCYKQMNSCDVRDSAPVEVYKKYKELSTRTALEIIPNFHWCLTKNCESGQVIAPDTTKFHCVACRIAYCIEHNVVWHEGETCEAYNRR